MSSEHFVPERDYKSHTLQIRASQEFKHILEQATKSASLNKLQFFTAVKSLVQIVGEDRRYREGDMHSSDTNVNIVSRSLPLHDVARKAKHEIEYRSNAFIDQGIITVSHESGVKEVIFAYDKQSISIERDNLNLKRVNRYATYVDNKSGEATEYNSLLTGEAETANPGETELVDVTARQMITVLKRLQTMSEQSNVRTMKPALTSGEVVFDAKAA